MPSSGDTGLFSAVKETCKYGMFSCIDGLMFGTFCCGDREPVDEYYTFEGSKDDF